MEASPMDIRAARLCLEEWNIGGEQWLGIYVSHRHAMIEAMTQRKTSLDMLRLFDVAAKEATYMKRESF